MRFTIRLIEAGSETDFTDSSTENIRHMDNSKARRVVITGVGVVSPLGLVPEEMLSRLRSGESLSLIHI